jgi:hypothetical protein
MPPADWPTSKYHPGTNPDFYKIASSSEGKVDGFGAELTLGLIDSHANGVKINPKATTHRGSILRRTTD